MLDRLLWMIATIAMPILWISATPYGAINGLGAIPMFFMKCRDPLFGNGRRFHWVRQTLLLVVVVASVIRLALWLSTL